MPTPSVPPAWAGVSLEAPGTGATAEVGQLSPRERGGLQRKSSGGLCTPSAGDLDSTPGQGTRSHMLQLKPPRHAQGELTSLAP